MAHKSNQNQPWQEAGSRPEGSDRAGEFEDAVTTEISDVLARAFGEDDAADPGDVYVTDMQLSPLVEPSADDVLAPGFLLKDRFEIVELSKALRPGSQSVSLAEKWGNAMPGPIGRSSTRVSIFSHSIPIRGCR